MFIRNAWYIAAWADELGQSRWPAAFATSRSCCSATRQGGPRRWWIAAVTARRRSLASWSRPASSAAITGSSSTAAGRCVAVPGQANIPDSARVRSYPLVEKNQFVWIWMGDAATADRAQDRRFSLSRRQGPMAEQARLLSDQGQLHADGRQSDGPDASRLPARQTVGGNPAAHVDAEMKTSAPRPASNSPAGCGIRCRRRAMSRPRASRAASTAGRTSNSSRRARSCNGPARPTPAAGV